MLSGFEVSSENYAPFLKPLEYISVFRYIFRIFITNEFTEVQPLNCMNNLDLPCDPLNKNYNFKENLWIWCLSLSLIFIFFTILGFIFMHKRSKMKA